jgi:hypothetical protein
MFTECSLNVADVEGREGEISLEHMHGLGDEEVTFFSECSQNVH